MKAINRTSVYAVAISLLLCFADATAAQVIKEQLFAEATQALKAAQAAKAESLAPKNYAKAIKLYRGAEQKFDRGKNLDTIRADLQAATTHFRNAVQVSKQAETKLGGLMKTRTDARKVKAATYSTDAWQRAEEKFSKAIVELERGTLKSAERNAKEAEKLYRSAELTAIKSSYLSETRLLLARADETKVDKYAPKTLTKAKDLLQQAEKALNQNRYDADLPRSLAQQAKYEAKHAIRLAQVIKIAREKKLTTEDVILDWETPVEQIAAAADMVAKLDNGYREPTTKIINFIEDQQMQSQKLKQDINDLQGQVNGLQAEVDQLQRMLGSTSEERVALAERLESQARIRKQFQQVEKMFSREEARVLREANDIIIRLVGLNFAVGRATIDPDNYYLLSKLKNVIGAFPGSRLIVEGHTDSHGSDAANYALSQRRADAVKQYLLANMRLDASNLTAIGYGETKPVANNETRVGRAKNRRIDVVISPKLKTAN